MISQFFLYLDDEGDDSSSGEEDEKQIETTRQGEPDKAGSARESEAGAEISALVNYVQPVHFVSFEVAESKYYLIIKIIKLNLLSIYFSSSHAF